MVSFVYRDGTTGEDIQPLVPDEQVRVRELREWGVVEALFLAADRSRGWFVMRSESEEDIREATASLPLYTRKTGGEGRGVRSSAPFGTTGT